MKQTRLKRPFVFVSTNLSEWHTLKITYLSIQFEFALLENTGHNLTTQVLKIEIHNSEFEGKKETLLD